QDRRFAGLRFTRQKPLDEYIVDFYCSELMVAIEIDGDSHAEQPDYDRQRTARLNKLRIEVMRYSNLDIMTNLTGAYEDLSRRIMDRRDPTP
ncbi:MAG: endonuclease domain-containing protein, partial [Dehalococcoidia bacterium]|nr:endonuclease domain-containing protein [Dehalococcoidia bacterium]